MLLNILCLLWLISPTWTVHVMARGGFAGAISLDLSVASDGTITCLAPKAPCPKQPDVTKLTSLIEMLPEQSILLTQPVQPVPPTSFCNDCLTRTIVIRRRDSEGIVRSYSAEWNDVDRNGVLPQLLQIYDTVIALQKAIAR